MPGIPSTVRNVSPARKSTMDCITCGSSAAVSSSSQAPRVSSIPNYSSAICSVDLLRSRDSRSPWNCFYLRRSLHFRNFGSSLKVSPTLCSSVPTVVSSNASRSPNQELRSSVPNPRGEDSGTENLSAKERRKLRNERREAAKASQEQPWREMVQDRLLEPKNKIRGWQEDADINRCIAKGFQWWMLQTAKRFEFEVAEQISLIFQENLPGREFEVFVPTVPVNTKLKDGSVSLARKKLYNGIVLLRCVLDRDIYFMVRKIPRAYDFFGNQAGLSLQPILMPAPVSNFNMDVMFQKIRKQEEEHEEFKAQCRRELEEERREKQRMDKEQQRRDLEQELLRSKGLTLAVGATVRVLSGPFLDFTGIVIELLPKHKIKALVTVFGNDTPIVLGIEDVVVEAPAGDQKSRMMFNL